MPRISVLIAYYKRLDALELVLQGLRAQSFSDFEVIVAEDDDAPETVAALECQRAGAPYAIKHVSQEDLGFRKNRALNAALRIAEGETVVFLDGDCIPHARLLHEYAVRQEPRLALYGRRAMLSEALSARLLAERNLRRLNIVDLLVSGSRKVEDALYLPWLPRRKGTSTGIWGCNWGIHRRHLLEVNGFDEDYVKAGIGEDVDIEWRLKAVGVALRSLKFKAVTYHLYHKAHYDQATVRENEALCRRKREAGRYYCTNGIERVAIA
jgi:glycosyltransferase involved in cell wall biosynthesis